MMRKTAWICMALAMACGACADLAMPAAPRPVSPAAVLMGGEAPREPVRLSSAPAAPASGGMTLCRLGGTNTAPAAYVVDGKRVDKDGLAAMNLIPEEIVSVEIIKGAAAVEQYGESVAGKGVVLIRTRAWATTTEP